jgi:hypothetical protein
MYLFPSSVQLTLEVLKFRILIFKALNPFSLFVLFHTTDAMHEKEITLQNSELNHKIAKSVTTVYKVQQFCQNNFNEPDDGRVAQKHVV